MRTKVAIWVGFDPREAGAYAVARHSITRRLTLPIPVRGLVLPALQAAGLYTRPIEWRPGEGGKSIMWDTISGAPMSTEHACARFLVPHLARSGWALFMDGDVLVRENLGRLFEQLDPKFAVYCVKHGHVSERLVKMDSQVQMPYSRKNWSSIVAFNCDHAANRALTVDMANTLPGRDLHRFCWLEDESLIGELDPKWNYLVGESPYRDDAAVAHFTLGTPEMAGYESVQFSDEWRDELRRWAA